MGEALDEAGIEYCRFDCEMPIKHRADAIAGFSVPIKDVPFAVDEPVGISPRLRPVTQSQSQPIGIDDDGDNPSGFAPGSESITALRSSREMGSLGPSKGKGKAKGKAPPKSSVLEALRELDRESNPRVVLVSLKCVHIN